MAGELFWDTSGFFALLNRDDPQHGRAREILAQAAAQRQGGLTTQWVIGECCTLLVARGRPHLVPAFLDLSEQSRSLKILPADPEFFVQTKAFVRQHLDHRYSFTDCASFVAMQAHGVRDAMTTDAHFVEAGMVALLR